MAVVAALASLVLPASAGGRALPVAGAPVDIAIESGLRALHQGEFGRAAAGLLGQAQVVVVLSHNGMDVDLKMASRVTGIDAIMGGHTHDGMPVASIISNKGGTGRPVPLLMEYLLQGV